MTAGPLPVFVLTGFLGSGKTTLLNALLPHYPDSALVINELGDIGIDDQLVEDRGDEVVFFDGRNAFEAKIGKFKNAIVPDVQTTHDFISELESGKYDHLKDKPVVTYCTGGIRCEILSVVMKNRGFNEVYQIDGGIVKYGERFGDEGDWEGSLYIFDDRMAMDFSDKTKVIGECDKCSAPTKTFKNCKTETCHQLILLCDPCADLPSNLSCTHDPARNRDSELVG